MKTKSQTVAADISALLRARNPLLWVTSREEARVEQYLIEAAAKAGYITRTWDVAQGIKNIDGTDPDGGGPETADPDQALGMIKDYSERTRNAERCVWIMRDLTGWIQPPAGLTTTRRLRNLARSLPGTPRDSAQAIIILSPSGQVPPELEGHTLVIDWPLPDRAEVASILEASVNSLPEFETNNQGDPDFDRPLRNLAAPNGVFDAAVDAAVGLSGEEAQSCYALSIVRTKRVDPAIVVREKRRVIAREKVIEWFDPLPGGLEAVGGLENLKDWLVTRKGAYSAKARAYGLPAPKGALVVGVPGCGKSLTAKAVSTNWGVPLLKVDLGAMKSKYVGDSEGTIRKAFKVIEAIGRCGVWFDEIEKSLGGATGGGADGGVSMDALGFLLGWMQDRQGESFVMATANNVESLPAELLRKGRFDETWFVDLPSFEERISILAAALKANNRNPAEIFHKNIAKACEGFSGAEIAAIVPDAMFAAFADNGREITTEDLLKSASTVVPAIKTSEKKISAIREWANGKARPASRVAETSKEVRRIGGRVLDV
jgi:AAA+ superfamily predicted ATPase